jgi:hypothetical protein
VEWIAAPNQPNFSEWIIVDTFDTAAECQGARADLVLKLPENVTVDREGYRKALPAVAKFAQCISSDDPRLKGGSR